MMKRFILASLAVVLLLAGMGYLVYYRGIYVDFKPEVSVTANFRTQGKEIQYLDGDTWKTMEIRGVDLSSNIPGEAMLDFVPTYEDYTRWLEQIGEMGANTIRVYTVMDADFYEALYHYNTTKEKSLYLLQGLSVPDRANYGAKDIYQEEFVDLLLENGIKAVDVIHGNEPSNWGILQALAGISGMFPLGHWAICWVTNGTAASLPIPITALWERLLTKALISTPNRKPPVLKQPWQNSWIR